MTQELIETVEIPEEPRAPDLKPDSGYLLQVDVGGVSAFVTWLVVKNTGSVYRPKYDLIAGGFFGSKAAMDTIRAFVANPANKAMRLHEEIDGKVQQSEVTITKKVTGRWSIGRVREVRYPGGRRHTAYETVVWHQRAEFWHDRESKATDPGHFYLLSEREENVCEELLRKLAVRSELPLHASFAQALWDDLVRRKGIRRLRGIGIIAYEVEVSDETLARIVGRLVMDGKLPTARALVGEPEETLEEFLDDDIYEPAEESPEYNPMPVAAD